MYQTRPALVSYLNEVYPAGLQHGGGVFVAHRAEDDRQPGRVNLSQVRRQRSRGGGVVGGIQ